MDPSLNQSFSAPKRALQGSSWRNLEGSLTSRAQLLVAGGNQRKQIVGPQIKQLKYAARSQFGTDSLGNLEPQRFQGLSGFGRFFPEPFGSLRHPVFTCKHLAFLLFSLFVFEFLIRFGLGGDFSLFWIDRFFSLCVLFVEEESSSWPSGVCQL